MEEEVFFYCVIYDVMRCCIGFLVKAMCGGKFDCMFCLEVLIDRGIMCIYSLFQMGWWSFGKLCAIIHLYFLEFLQGADDRCVIIVNVSLVWGVKRFGQKECWWQEVQVCALIIAYGTIVVIQSL